MDYQSNSDKAKERPPKPEKIIEKVVVGEVVQKPQGIGHKFRHIFFGGDFKNAARYVAADVLLPALRNLLVDITTGGIEKVVYGDSPNRRRRPTNYGAISNIQYSNPLMRDPRHISRAQVPDQPPGPYRTDRRTMDNFVLATRAEADNVVERLGDILDKYEVVSYGDLMDLLGLPSTPIDQKWGWSYLTNVAVRQVRNGYLIEFPALEPI